MPYFANRELQLKTEAINDQKNGAWFKYHAYGQSEVNCRLMDGLADGDCNNYNSEDQLYLRVTSVLGECEARGENTKDTSRLLELSSSRRS